MLIRLRCGRIVSSKILLALEYSAEEGRILLATERLGGEPERADSNWPPLSPEVGNKVMDLFWVSLFSKALCFDFEKAVALALKLAV